MSSTFETVAGIISETCDIPREKITPESHAINDLGIDSLDFLDVAFAIDKAFGIKMPLEQWTQEVNEGKVSSDEYFVLEATCAPTSTSWWRRRPPDTGMKLEYFQMVDRIVELDPEARVVRADCLVPDASPVFEGHFPGHPLLPGALMIETMAQTGGWLVLAVLRFQRMPFLAQVKEAKMRAFVVPGQALQAEARLLHDGSGYAVVAGSITSGGKQGGGGRDHVPRRPLPQRDIARSDAGNRAACRACRRRF